MRQRQRHLLAANDCLATILFRDIPLYKGKPPKEGWGKGGGGSGIRNLYVNSWESLFLALKTRCLSPSGDLGIGLV